MPIIIKTALLKNILVPVVTGVALLSLSACMTTRKDETPELGQTENEADKSSEIVELKQEECPDIQILEGTGILTAYADSASEKPDNIAHQATIIRSGRKCSLIDGTLALEIGVAGRAAKGPKSFGESATMPIRIAVVREEQEVLFSQLYNQFVPLGSDGAQEFSLKENTIRIPSEKRGNIKILVGFDTLSENQPASRKTAKAAGKKAS